MSKNGRLVFSGQIFLRPAEPIKNYGQAIKIMSHIPCAKNDVILVLHNYSLESLHYITVIFKETTFSSFFHPQEKSWLQLEPVWKVLMS